MRLGDVVVNTEDGARGVVVHDGRRGRLYDSGPLFAGDYSVRISSGIYRQGNMTGCWESVPEDQWTAVERVLSVSVTWEPADWYGPGDQVQECDEFGFALLRALLPPAVRARVFGDGDWPCTFGELGAEVAAWLDHALARQEE